MAPLTAPTFAHTLDACIKQQAGDNLAQHLDLLDGHVLALFQGLAPNDKYPENVSGSLRCSQSCCVACKRRTRAEGN